MDLTEVEQPDSPSSFQEARDQLVELAETPSGRGTSPHSRTGSTVSEREDTASEHSESSEEEEVPMTKDRSIVDKTPHQDTTEESDQEEEASSFTIKRSRIYDLVAGLSSVEAKLSEWAATTRSGRKKERLQEVLSAMENSKEMAQDMGAALHRSRKLLDKERGKNRLLKQGLSSLGDTFQTATRDLVGQLSEQLTTVVAITVRKEVEAALQRMSETRSEVQAPAPTARVHLLSCSTQTEQPEERVTADAETQTERPTTDLVKTRHSQTQPVDKSILTLRNFRSAPSSKGTQGSGSKDGLSFANAVKQRRQDTDRPRPLMKTAQSGQNNRIHKAPAAEGRGSRTPSAGPSKGSKNQNPWKVVQKKKPKNANQTTKLLVRANERGPKGDDILTFLGSLELPADLPLKNVRAGRNVVEITCGSPRDADEIKGALEAMPDFQTHANVRNSTPPEQRIILMKVPAHHSKEEVRARLKQALPLCTLQSSQIKAESRSLPGQVNNWAITLPRKDAQALLKQKRIHFGLKPSEIQLPAKPVYCFLCQGLGHLASACSYGIVCAVCSGEHPTDDCAKPPYCVNCWRENYYNNTQYDTYHHASSLSCPVFMQYEDKVWDTNNSAF